MTNTKLVLSAVAALAIGVAGPAFAQSVGSSATTSGDHSSTTSVDLQLAASDSSTHSDSSQRTNNSQRNDNSQRSFDLTDNSQRNNNSQRNGNVRLVADQTLDASISNERGLNFNGTRSDYASGSNSVNGGAFAAYSGILNQGWNTGINSNAQAATNIAAQGTTNFTTH